MTDNQINASTITTDQAASYFGLRSNRGGLGVMSLARKVDHYETDMRSLEGSGESAAAAGAGRMLRMGMVLLAAAVAEGPRQLARKERALLPARVEASGLPEVAVKMIAAGLEAERAKLAHIGSRLNADEGGMDPAVATFYTNCAKAGTLAEVLRQHVGLRHDREYMLRKGRTASAQRIADMAVFDVLRPASRAATSYNEAGVKIALIDELEGGTPLLRAMLGAVAAIERRTWDMVGTALCIGNKSQATFFPGEEERCKRRDATPVPMDVTTIIEQAEAHWRNLAVVRRSRNPSDIATGCLCELVDAGLRAAATPARNKSEVERKLEFIVDLLHELGPDADTYAAVMLHAALAFECESWGIPLIVVNDRVPIVRQ